MNHYAPTPESGSWLRTISRIQLIVVDNAAAVKIPNLDAEFVYTAAAVDIAIDSSQHKAVVAAAIDGAGSFVLGSSASYHQPVIAGAMEIQIGYFELKLGLTVGYACAGLILRDKAEIRFAGQQGIR